MIVQKVVENNAFFAFPEVMVTSMLEDESEEVRRDGVLRILAARRDPPAPPTDRLARGIRVNKLPNLNWEAEDWTKIIEWNKVELFEPTITKKITEAELLAAIEKPLELPNYPCHSQSVERCVKLVSEASHQVYGADKRHGLILSQVASRKRRKCFESKKDFKIDEQL